MLTSLDTDAYLISLDFQQAFDNVHPTLAIRIMSQLGLPAGICNMLTNVWSQQQRYMYLDIVRQSLPQGDAFSMMAMIATLTPATVALRGQFPDVVHRTYCDDRTFCGRLPLFCNLRISGVDGQRRWASKKTPTKVCIGTPLPRGAKSSRRQGCLQHKSRNILDSWDVSWHPGRVAQIQWLKWKDSLRPPIY